MKQNLHIFFFVIGRVECTLEQTLPISLNASNFDLELLTTPKMLKYFIHQYKCQKEIFGLKERHNNMDANLPNKNFCIIIGYYFGNIFTM